MRIAEEEVRTPAGPRRLADQAREAGPGVLAPRDRSSRASAE